MSFIVLSTTVRPLLSVPLLSVPPLSADLVYPRFLRPKLSTPNLYELQSNLYYLHVYYPLTSFIRSFWDQSLVRSSTADNRGLTVKWQIFVLNLQNIYIYWWHKIATTISYRVTGLYRLGKTYYLHSLLCNNNIIAQFPVQ